MKKVSIVILNWNGRKYLKDCIESIKKNTKYSAYEIIVVDNGSAKEDVDLIKEFKSKKLVDKVIFNKENRGFAFANNQGFEIAEGGYYFMLNNDTMVKKGWLENSVKLAESDEKIAAVGSKLVDFGPQMEKELSGKEKIRTVLTTCGAAMLMKKSVVDKIGKLDSKNFSPIYGEETDWCYRARNAGYKIVETNASKIIHLGSRDTKRQTGKKWQYELLNTHRLKAMFFNLSIIDFIRNVPGLGLIFLTSIKDGMALALLKSYWNNIKNIKLILIERNKRKSGEKIG